MINAVKIFSILCLMTFLQSLAEAKPASIAQCFAGAKNSAETPGGRDEKRLFCLTNYKDRTWADCLHTARGMEYTRSSDLAIQWCLDQEIRKKPDLIMLQSGLSLIGDPEIKEDLLWTALRQNDVLKNKELCINISNLMPYLELQKKANQACIQSAH